MTGACRECPEEGLPEWIMSYADMITILMAFFVVMYSMAGVKKDDAKVEAVLRSFRSSLGPFASVLPGSIVPKDSALAGLVPVGLGPVEGQAAPDGEAKTAPPPQIRVPRGSEPLAVGSVIFFDGASDKLSETNRLKLDEVAAALAGKPQRIEIRGHASRRPLPADSPYRDHWDLSYARCRRTLEFLVAAGIDPARVRLGVAPQVAASQTARHPLLLVSDSRVEVFMMNEFAEQFPAGAVE